MSVGSGFDPGVFWDAAREGRLLLRRCHGCTRHHHYPRATCPFCHSTDVGWVEAAGTGTLYAFVAIERGPGAGTVPALITLTEGVTVQSAVVDAGPRSLAIGATVIVTFRPAGDGRHVPFFTPVDYADC